MHNGAHLGMLFLVVPVFLIPYAQGLSVFSSFLRVGFFILPFSFFFCLFLICPVVALPHLCFLFFFYLTTIFHFCCVTKDPHPYYNVCINDTLAQLYEKNLGRFGIKLPDKDAQKALPIGALERETATREGAGVLFFLFNFFIFFFVGVC